MKTYRSSGVGGVCREGATPMPWHTCSRRDRLTHTIKYKTEQNKRRSLWSSQPRKGKQKRITADPSGCCVPCKSPQFAHGLVSRTHSILSVHNVPAVRQQPDQASPGPILVALLTGTGHHIVCPSSTCSPSENEEANPTLTL